MRKTGLLALMCIGLSGMPSAISAAERLEVVASFSILADFAEQVGGERVSVTSLVGPNGDAHVYEPTPKDAQKVAQAGVMVVNGLGLEGWLDRLLEASGSKALVTVASEGIAPIGQEDHEHEEDNGEAHGGLDPHAFQNAGNAVIYVRNIARALCEAAASECDFFRRNAEAYVASLETLDREVRTAVARIPADKRRIISSHDAFGYFAHAYGVSFLAPEGVSTDAEASAADVAKLIQQIKQAKASALFVENISDRRLIEQIGRETGLEVSGVLFSDALSQADGPAASYIAMMRHNVRTILAAIEAGS